MSLARPLVSVVLPVHNGERFLRDALVSIEQQRYHPIEVVVVDDGSTDGTASMLAELGPTVQVIRQPNAGPAAARNRGIEHARGALVAFLDADDLWPAEKLERQVTCLVEEPDVDVVLGRIQYVALDGAAIPDIAFDDPDAKTISNVHLGSGVFRHRAFETVGAFDESLRVGEDHDWFLRARERGLRIRILPAVTLIYRLHAQNMTLDRTPQEVALTRVLKKSLDRRRASGAADQLGRWHDFGSEVTG